MADGGDVDGEAAETVPAAGPMTERARGLLHARVQSERLRKHYEAVWAAIRYFARNTGTDEDL